MSVVLTLNDASLSIVDLHAAMQQGCQKRQGPGGGGALCVQMDFTGTFETTTQSHYREVPR